jgi:hypothetical protein
VDFCKDSCGKNYRKGVRKPRIPMKDFRDFLFDKDDFYPDFFGKDGDPAVPHF